MSGDCGETPDPRLHVCPTASASTSAHCLETLLYKYPFKCSFLLHRRSHKPTGLNSSRHSINEAADYTGIVTVLPNLQHHNSIWRHFKKKTKNTAGFFNLLSHTLPFLCNSSGIPIHTSVSLLISCQICPNLPPSFNAPAPPLPVSIPLTIAQKLHTKPLTHHWVEGLEEREVREGSGYMLLCWSGVPQCPNKWKEQRGIGRVTHLVTHPKCEAHYGTHSFLRSATAGVDV